MKVDDGDAHTISLLVSVTGQFKGHVDKAIALIEEEPRTPGSLAYALDLSPNYIQRLIKVVLAARPGFKLDYVTDPATGNHTTETEVIFDFAAFVAKQENRQKVIDRIKAHDAAARKKFEIDPHADIWKIYLEPWERDVILEYQAMTGETLKGWHRGERDESDYIEN